MRYTKETYIIRLLGQSLARQRLYWFNKYILKYPDINERVHGPMCDFYQPHFDKSGENDFAMDLEPRDTMKTTFCVVGGVVWLLACNPNSRNLILASSHKEAIKRLNAAKGQMQAKRLIAFFFYDMVKNARSKTSWKAESIVVYNRTSLDLEPSIDTGGRGTDKLGNHYGGGIDERGNPFYGGIFVDDIETSDTAISEEERETTILCVIRLSPCLQPKWSILRITGTRWGFNEIYSRILGKHEIDKDRFDYYRTRVMSAWINDVEGHLGMDGKTIEDGTLYYPERLTYKLLEREKKTLGTYLFSCNYRNNPIAAEDCAFPPKDTMYYYGEYIKEGTARYICVEKVICAGNQNYKWLGGDKVQIRSFITVDPALTDAEKGCSTGIVICGQELQDNRIWVTDAMRLKSGNAYIIIDNLIALYLKFEPLAIIIEECVFQRALAQFFDGECKKQGIHPRIELVGRSDHRSKDERVFGLSNFWKANAIMMPVKKGPVEDLIQELYHFPKSRTRDLSDSFARLLDVKYGVQQKDMTKKIMNLEKDFIDKWKKGREI